MTSWVPHLTTEPYLRKKAAEMKETIALHTMVNSKAVGTDGLPTEVLKLELVQDGSILRKL